MSQATHDLKPLDLAKHFGVRREDVSIRLGVTPDWLTKLARNPRHARRVFVAELEAVLEQQKLELTLESLLRSRQ
jgi:hypothetical protein